MIKLTNRTIMIKLNIGSGQRPFGKPWVNMDCQSRWNPDICDDGVNVCNHYTPGTVDMIVLHHVLEHYGCGEAGGLLVQCHRALKDKGSLIVCVPNPKDLARRWLSGELTDQVYFTNVYGAYMGDEADRHRWSYTVQSLKEILFSAGFTHVRDFNWRKIEGADIARDWWVLALEAIK